MNFTIKQIKQAHNKVKSGADFLAYIRDIQQIGVVSYETYVVDGHSEYLGKDYNVVISQSEYTTLTIAALVHLNTFEIDLHKHQHGETDYMTFCKDCAKSGIAKWTIDIIQGTCTYYDKVGEIILVESIGL